MDFEENPLLRKSQIRPPSRIPSPGKILSEISESQSNTRSKPSMLPPPPNSKLSSYSRVINENEPKRKTLVERGGEPARTGAITSHDFRPQVRGTSLVRAGAGYRHASTSSSISSRNGSSRNASSRNVSNSSFSSSMGPGTRPGSSFSTRPQTSMAFSQSTTTRPFVPMASKRPATSMDDHEQGEGPTDGKRQGMTTLSDPSSISFVHDNMPLQLHKRRGSKSRNTLQSLPEGRSVREVSITTALSQLRLDDSGPSIQPAGQHASYRVSKKPYGSLRASMRKSKLDARSSALVLFQSTEESAPKTPSHIPIPTKSEAVPATPATPSKIPKISPQKTPFLTKDSNVPSFIAWDVSGRLEDVELMYTKLQNSMGETTIVREGMEEVISQCKARLFDMEGKNARLESANAVLESKNTILESRTTSQSIDADTMRQQILTAKAELEDSRRRHRNELEDQERENRYKLEKVQRELSEELESLKRSHQRSVADDVDRLKRTHKDELSELERRSNQDLETERRMRLQEVQEIKAQILLQEQNLDDAVGNKDREIQSMRDQLEEVRGELDREHTLKGNLQKKFTDALSTVEAHEGTIRSLRDRIQFLESGSKAQSDRFGSMEKQLEEAQTLERAWKEKLIKEETLRRILFNQVQELKGNIRVMCRVRPTFDADSPHEVAKIAYPDIEKEAKELELQGAEEKSSLGTITRKTNAFSFDRVFGPATKNEEVFGEISQLVQSALDGYNVCIFCYGQTGSGKTHTMSSADGMIPRATHMIYEKAGLLQEKGWTYTMEGSFVEVYNEDIHDLLGNPKEFDKKKHDIRHDDQKKQTTVTNLKTVPLDSPNAVELILKQADANRSVAATKSNERSSRSHSVFILKLVGRNSTTNETSEGTLNLVDLAGSERLKSSGAEGDRMKETQNINKSLSCLGDVIGALGQGKEGAHIPYRNSKLTYLLQYSLGGNSKTLMFVMISPLEHHVKETLTSLKFATKVHNTHIGTAKKSTKVRDKSSDS